jgi:hypothetical protein
MSGASCSVRAVSQGLRSRVVELSPEQLLRTDSVSGVKASAVGKGRGEGGRNRAGAIDLAASTGNASSHFRLDELR